MTLSIIDVHVVWFKAPVYKTQTCQYNLFAADSQSDGSWRKRDQLGLLWNTSLRISNPLLTLLSIPSTNTPTYKGSSPETLKLIPFFLTPNTDIIALRQILYKRFVQFILNNTIVLAFVFPVSGNFLFYHRPAHDILFVTLTHY